MLKSRAFAESIVTQKLGPGETLVSFDVVSLFTCIPTDLAVKVARQRLEDDPSLVDWMKLRVDDIVTLLSYYITNITVFTSIPVRATYYL